MSDDRPIIGFPNHASSTFVGSGYEAVVFSGGSWEPTRPLTYLTTKYLKQSPRSTSAATDDTWFHVDLGSIRDILFSAMVNGNYSRSAQIRKRGMNQVAWSGVTVNGVNTLNDTTLSVATGAAGAAVKAGDGFTIAGDTQVYQATVDVTIGASTTGIITLERVGDAGTGLALATVGAEAITCHAGLLTATVVDTGYIDVWQEIYAFGTLPYGHPSLIDGKATAEDASELRIPYVSILAETELCRYWRYDISDATNPNGYVKPGGHLFMCPGYEPQKGVALNPELGQFTDTVVVKNSGGADEFNRFDTGRQFFIALNNLSEDEAMSRTFDLITRAGIDKLIFFILNKNATVHMMRTAFPARLEKLDPIMLPFRADAAFRVKEALY